MCIPEVEQPEDFGQPTDWDEVLVPLTVTCVPTHKTLKDYFEHIGDFTEDHDDAVEQEEEAKRVEAETSN